MALLMIALFTVAIISFAINFAIDNDSAISLDDDTEFSSLTTKTRQNLSDFKTDSEDTYSSIVSTTVEPGSDVVRSSGSFSVTWSNVLGITSNIMKVGYQKIFGSGEGFGIFITAFISMLGFLMALYLIKTWRGNP
jgi:hypothetical protein